MTKIQVHIHELVPAFHNGSTSAQFYLDRETGQVLLDFDGMMYDDQGEDIRHLLGEKPERFVQIESIGSRDTEKMMRAFIESEPDKEACKALLEALSTNRPFQNFRNALGDYPEVRQRFYEFEGKWVENLARTWIRHHGVDAELIVPDPEQAKREAQEALAREQGS